jgi:uncharacterized protein (DUF433 family)
MTTAAIDHIVLDERGVAYVKDSRIKVALLIVGRRSNGWSAEELQQQFPQLSMAQVYAALAYYHDHQATIEAEIRASTEWAAQKRNPDAISKLIDQRRVNPS